ncbi:hypothetical protein B0A50_08503 [Salinomyces thailandicus]|uniref:Clavaminate synthase-like protein n=1 Tax=Salinomyces thailandicus TaxID=706561 RepID=A0A4U0TJ71_9PEZI|nr:hypothetical protein B0A50_08503 [Salinomyces thailandica]
MPQPSGPQSKIDITLDGQSHQFSPILLRDLCQCHMCVDPSTRQKLFSTTDIPENIAPIVERGIDADSVRLKWRNDISGFPHDHVTDLKTESLSSLAKVGSPIAPFQPPERALWEEARFRKDVRDLDYEAYMSDDSILHQALQYLHTHGLVFLTNVPEQESSVASIAERIGPVKNTFYGYTWDVRSIPQAKNVAYTSQDLGFHMDLLYMEQPPHLQFLHCIRASTAGGVSTFTDSYKAALDLFRHDLEAFITLSRLPVNYHYNHLESNYYFHSRPVLELKQPLFGGDYKLEDLSQLFYTAQKSGFDITKWLDNIAWSPPFQAPFSNQQSQRPSLVEPMDTMNSNISEWHNAAKLFDQLIHRTEGVYRRMMKPGECALFDNRRVLHAREAFEVGDIGKERWLRGAYLDRDPYRSKMRVLQERFGQQG